MNKTVVLFFSILFVFGSAFAQKEKLQYLPNFDKQKIHWGYYLGYNNKGLKISYKEPNRFVRVEQSGGFNVGLIGDLRLFKNLNLRLEPGLSHNSKTLYFTNILTAQDSVRKIPGTYLHIPLLLKFSANRLNNIRPFVLAGISYDFNFSSGQNNPDDNFQGNFRMKKNNYMYEIGFGIDFYLLYFKFSPSIRGIFAINNELVRDNPSNGNSQWTGPIDYFGTRGIFINFSFE